MYTPHTKASCVMVRWTVADQPRLGRFAGDHGLSAGDELTDDDHFRYGKVSSATKMWIGQRSHGQVLNTHESVRTEPIK